MELSEQEALPELLRCQDMYALLAEVLRHLCFSRTRVLLNLYTLQPQHLADQDFDKLRVTDSGRETPVCDILRSLY